MKLYSVKYPCCLYDLSIGAGLYSSNRPRVELLGESPSAAIRLHGKVCIHRDSLSNCPFSR